MRKFFSLLIIPIAVLILACGDGSMLRYPNNDRIPNNCESPNPDPAYFRREIFPRFDLNSNTLSLVNWYTGDTERVLATFDSIGGMHVLDWSPNCRYFMTIQNGDGVIWDTVTGDELVRYSEVPNFSYFSTSITWDSTTQYVTVESAGSTYLFTLANRNSIRLVEGYFIRQYWDVARGQLIGISNREVASYDLNTGAKVVTYGDVNGGRRLAISPDGSRLAFFSDNSDRDFTLQVFNRDGSGAMQLFVGDYVSPGHIAFSPDNRYLAIGGYMLSVWDLNNPPAQSVAREPMYQYEGPVGYIDSVVFINSDVVETDDGAAWNILTGAQVEG